MTIDYKKKYLKYKNKYLNLKGGVLSRSQIKILEKEFFKTYGLVLIPLEDRNLILRVDRDTNSNTFKLLKVISDSDGLLNFDLTDTTNNLRYTDNDIYYFKKLQIEIITSFFVTYIGEFMQEIVVNLNNKFGNNILVSSTINEKIFDDMKKNNELNNTLVPVGKDYVHWVYIDNNGVEYNPYDYNMQKLDSHQFCQSHALILAYKQDYRIKTTPQKAYNRVIALWNYILDNNLINHDFIDYVVEKLREVNYKEIPIFVNTIIKKYLDPFNSDQIKLLISSELAKRLAPEFS